MLRPEEEDEQQLTNKIMRLRKVLDRLTSRSTPLEPTTAGSIFPNPFDSGDSNNNAAKSTPQTERPDPCSECQDAPLDLSLATQIRERIKSESPRETGTPDPYNYYRNMPTMLDTLKQRSTPSDATISDSETDAEANSIPDLLKSLYDYENPFTCTVCGETFVRKDRLSKHMASRHRDLMKPQTKSRGHICTICFRGFSRSDMLTRHARLHTGDKPYSCTVCNQVFSRSDHLSTHRRTHTGEKPYRCPLCPYEACRRDMVTRHMKTHSLKTFDSK